MASSNELSSTDVIKEALGRLQKLEEEASAIRENIERYFIFNHSDEFAAVRQNMLVREDTGERKIGG
jgi:hypothetical protein